MKIVIDIPEEKYKALKVCQQTNMGVGMLDKAVLEGMIVTEDNGSVLDRILEIIDKVAADYEALPTEIDVGREKAAISFEKKDGMLAMASMIRVLVLGLRGEQK